MAISKGFNDHYHVEGPNPKNQSLFVFWLFEKKKIRPILRRGSISKKNDDHYHVEGHHLTKEINDHCLAEGLDLKRSMTIASHKVLM